MNERFTAVLQKSPAKGDGTHMLPVKAELRRAVGKEAGDTVTVELEERLAG